MSEAIALHHVQVAIPAGGEGRARDFYGEVCAFEEVAKPPTLTGRGGVWFRTGDLELHCGVDDDFRPARKAHPGILVDGLDALTARLGDAGRPVRPDTGLPGYRRVHTEDPFGNRLEFLEAEGGPHPAAGATGRLAAQLAFLLEVDRLKRVARRTTLSDASRRENSAEHSWHLALCALALAEHAAEAVDVDRVVRMVLLHDLVEIDAGDTFAYDAEGRLDQEERERRAADRIFALLPDEQAAGWRALWDEFEAEATPESRFAKAIDRLQPILLNLASGGVAWREHGIAVEQVLARNRPLIERVPALWDHLLRVIDVATERGYLTR